jgi:hypothetical protein
MQRWSIHQAKVHDRQPNDGESLVAFIRRSRLAAAGERDLEFSPDHIRDLEL